MTRPEACGIRAMMREFEYLYDNGFKGLDSQALHSIEGHFVQMIASRYIHTAKILLAAGALVVGLSACGTTNWGFPYRATIQQGNWITSEQVAKLQVGMTRDQVRFILGTPALQDIFHADRWDYPFYNQPGYGEDELRKFTVWFDQDQLTRWEGDEQPDRQPFQKADSGKEAIEETPPSSEAPSEEQ